MSTCKRPGRRTEPMFTSAEAYPLGSGRCACAKFLLPPADGGIREGVGFGVFLTSDVGNGEIERARKFAASPVQGIEHGARAAVDAGHLLDHDFGVGEHMQALGLEGERTLQGFDQGDVFGDVVVLAANPLGDADGTGSRAVHYHANAGWPGVSLGAAVDVCHQIRHR